jgi:hypothetical protein
MVGTTVWEPVLSNTETGVVTTTIHLDNDPMDGVYEARREGIFELYAQLVGGADNGADTRGAPAAGPNGGSGGYARGLLSSGGIGLFDSWNLAVGAPWKSNKWAATSPSSSRVVDVASIDLDSRGRIYGSSTARATGQTNNLADAEVTFAYKFSDRNSGSDLRVHLRGSGATGSNQVPNAYRLDIDSGDPTIKLKKVINGTATSIPGGTFTYNLDSNWQQALFKVQGSQIKVKVWPANQPEPGTWNIAVTDTAVTAPGKLQVTHYYYGSGSPRSVYVDHLTLDEDTAFEAAADPGAHPPCTRWEHMQQPPFIDSDGLAWICDHVTSFQDEGDYYGWVLVH